jgi:hypothetical protein
MSSLEATGTATACADIYNLYFIFGAMAVPDYGMFIAEPIPVNMYINIHTKSHGALKVELGILAIQC